MIVMSEILIFLQLLCCVGNDNYFGIRATTIPYVAIGDHNIIQAGMVVDKSIGNDTTIFHRFKEKVMVLSVSSKED